MTLQNILQKGLEDINKEIKKHEKYPDSNDVIINAGTMNSILYKALAQHQSEILEAVVEINRNKR